MLKGIFDKVKEPVFLKDLKPIDDDIEKLESIKNQLKVQKNRDEIDLAIKNMKKGYQGELDVIYELKHIHFINISF